MREHVLRLVEKGDLHTKSINTSMVLKYCFDRVVALMGLIALCWLYPIVAILIKIKMPGGPILFVQKRVGKDGKLFNCHKFRTMTASPQPSPEGKGATGWSTVSVAGDSRITSLGAKLRHYKIDELPDLWDVLIGKMSFVGPRPDVPGYADKLEGEDRVILKLRPGITGPATLKYRLEDEMIAEWVKGERVEVNGERLTVKVSSEESLREKSDKNLIQNLPKDVNEMTDQELAVWYNDNVIYPDKVRLNKYYYEHYSFWKDIQMIVCTVLGKRMKYAGEEI